MIFDWRILSRSQHRKREEEGKEEKEPHCQSRRCWVLSYGRKNTGKECLCVSGRAGKVVLGVDPAARFRTGGVVKTGGGGEKKGGGMRSTEVVAGTATVSNEFIVCCAVPKHEGSPKEVFFKKM